MPDTYKLQYDGMTLTYPGWNGCMAYNYEPEQTSALLYTSAFDFTAKAATERKMNVNYTFPTATYDYFAVKYGCAFTANGTIEYDYNVRSNNFDWSLIVCDPVTGNRVPMYWGNNNFTSTGVTVNTNGSTKRVYINGVSPQTVRPYKVSLVALN